MTVLLLITTAFLFVAWILAQLAIRMYRDLLAAANQSLARVERELDEIKSEIEEHVLDGLDFNLIEAIVDIRHWKELAKTAETKPMMPSLRKSRKV